MTLKHQAFSAARATSLSYGLRFFLQLLQVAVLARVLKPADFGLMAVAAAFSAILGMLADFGISRALIHFRDISGRARSSLYWLNLLLACCLALVLAATSPAIAAVYGEPMLGPVLALAGVVFPLSALGQQHMVLAEKELRFSKLAGVEIAAALAGLFTSVLLALTGWGVYSMVFGVLASAATVSLLAWVFLADGWRPSWGPHVADVRPMLRFGSYLVGENIAGTLHREADVMVGGLLVGAAPLGAFSLARNLALKLATTVVNPVVTRVGFPVLARVQHDRTQLSSIYLSMVRMVSSVNFPLYALLGLFASDIVVLLYGPGWEQTAVYLQILAVWGGIRSIGNPIGSLVVAVGRARLAFVWNLALLLLTPAVLLLGAWYDGLRGLAWSLVALQILIFLPMWRVLVYPLCGASLRRYAGQLWPPLGATVVAGIASRLAILPLDMPLIRLMAGSSMFIGCYLLLSYRFNRPWFDAMHLLLVPRRGGKAGMDDREAVQDP